MVLCVHSKLNCPVAASGTLYKLATKHIHGDSGRCAGMVMERTEATGTLLLPANGEPLVQTYQTPTQQLNWLIQYVHANGACVCACGRNG